MSQRDYPLLALVRDGLLLGLTPKLGTQLRAREPEPQLAKNRRPEFGLDQLLSLLIAISAGKHLTGNSLFHGVHDNCFPHDSVLQMFPLP